MEQEQSSPLPNFFTLTNAVALERIIQSFQHALTAHRTLTQMCIDGESLYDTPAVTLELNFVTTIDSCASALHLFIRDFEQSYPGSPFTPSPSESSESPPTPTPPQGSPGTSGNTPSVPSPFRSDGILKTTQTPSTQAVTRSTAEHPTEAKSSQQSSSIQHSNSVDLIEQSETLRGLMDGSVFIVLSPLWPDASTEESFVYGISQRLGVPPHRIIHDRGTFKDYAVLKMTTLHDDADRIELPICLPR